MAVIPNQAQQQQATPEPERPKPERKHLGPGSLAGNITRDPELRYTPNGTAVSTLRIAVSERIKDPTSGEWKDAPAKFFDVICWAQLAEHCAEHLAKGQRIVAEGQWESRSWAGEDGQVHEQIELVAADLGPSMRFRGARVEPKKGGPQT
jgi:single-strand DNA-binding protein